MMHLITGGEKGLSLCTFPESVFLGPANGCRWIYDISGGETRKV
jgi:hypothetical protein